MTLADLLFCAAAALLFYAAYNIYRWPDVRLAYRVRGLMLCDADEEKENARVLRTVLLLDGHRLPKHTRDAAAVWLAERDGR